MSAGPRQRSLFAFYAHRVSGLGLALFLPVHFYVLSLALTDPAGFESFIAFTDQPLVKLMESLLVVLLAIHLIFGCRLLVMELFDWPSPRDMRLRWIDAGITGAIVLGALFLLVTL